jgi:hypothetical protein
MKTMFGSKYFVEKKHCFVEKVYFLSCWNMRCPETFDIKMVKFSLFFTEAINKTIPQKFWDGSILAENSTP